MKNILGHGLELDTMTSDSELDSMGGVLATNQMKDVQSRVKLMVKNETDVTTGYIIPWSDDFQVNYVRGSRSIWVLTITVCPPKTLIVSPLYTYAIALGRKGDDHSGVLRQFMKDLTTLGVPTYEYCGSLLRMKTVSFHMLVFPCDRPEKCSINGLVGGTSLWGKCWKTSAKVEGGTFISCPKFFKCRLDKYIILPRDSNGFIYQCSESPQIESKCHVCCDCDLIASKKACWSELPQKWPYQKEVENDRDDGPEEPDGRTIWCMSLPPVKMTYEWLVKCVRYAIYHYRYGAWNKSLTRCYLQACCINEFWADQFMKVGDDCKHQNLHGELIFSGLKYPGTWLGCINLDQFPDSGLHLLLQGLVNDILDTTLQEYLYVTSSKAKFGRLVVPVMKKVEELKLDFCRMECLQGDKYTLGGWIGESYLAFGRLLPVYICATEDFISDDKEDHHSLVAFKCLTMCLYCLLSRVLCPEEIKRDEFEDVIKFLMISAQAFSKVFYKEGTFWETKPNWWSLINLVDQVETFGKLRLYWEGRYERYIQYVKPLLLQSRKTDTFLDLKLKTLHQSACCTNINKNNASLQEEKINQYTKYSSIKVYKSLKDVNFAAISGHPISAAYLVDDDGNVADICVAVKVPKSESIEAFPLTFGYSGDYIWGVYYTSVCVSQAQTRVFESLSCFAKSAKTYLLLHPVVTSCLKEDSPMYCCIDDTWKIMNHNISFVRPLIPIKELKDLLNKLASNN